MYLVLIYLCIGFLSIKKEVAAKMATFPDELSLQSASFQDNCTIMDNSSINQHFFLSNNRSAL